MEQLRRLGHSQSEENTPNPSPIELAIDSHIQHSPALQWPEESREALRSGALYILERLQNHCNGNWNSLRLQSALDEIKYEHNEDLKSGFHERLRKLNQIDPQARGSACSRVLKDVIGMMQYHTTSYEEFLSRKRQKMKGVTLPSGGQRHRRSGPSRRRNG